VACGEPEKELSSVSPAFEQRDEHPPFPVRLDQGIKVRIRVRVRRFVIFEDTAMIQQQPNDPNNPKTTDITSNPSPEHLQEPAEPIVRRRPLHVIPAGALLVGLLASSGYALAAWFSGRRISGGLLLTIICLQVLAYFAAQYIAFLDRGPVRSPTGSGQMGFFEYFDLTTKAFAWKKTSGNGVAEPLGKLGYLLRFGEILGFSLGALILPLALWGVPYCELCERYMKTRQLAVLPAETAAAEEVTRLAGAKDIDGFANCVQGHQANSKANNKLPRRISVTLIHCPQCSGGRLKLMREEGSGQQARATLVSVLPLAPEFVRDVVAARLARNK
jgi:hypothetical protein